MRIRAFITAGIIATTLAVPTMATAAAAAPTSTATTVSIDRQWAYTRYGTTRLPMPIPVAKRLNYGRALMSQIRQAQRFAATPKARAITWRESHNIPSVVSAGGAYHGLWQFDRQTWQANGGRRYAPVASKAPAWAQNHIAYLTWKRYGWRPWGG